MHTYTWDTVPAEQLDQNIARRMIVGKKQMLVHWEFKKGSLAARHHHPHEQVVLMVSGRMRLAVGEDETILGPGDIVVIPSEVPHEAEALEDSVAVDLFSPPREDFLTGESPAYMKK
jgi:quercetin dioxygenase-like cupin family protein